MTTLSPRLAHLLIHEDRSTGRLILPDGSKIRPSSEFSPPLSPLSFGADSSSPTELSRSLPPTSALLPPPRLGGAQRPSQSIFSILNEARQTTPPSSASSTSTGPLHIAQPGFGLQRPRSHEVSRQTPSPPLPSPHSIYPSSYDSRGAYFPPQHAPSSLAPRPDMFRRHSSHPYEYGPSRPYTTGSVLEESNLVSGSRAPISRTTKACNACRSRKVRCDAGGLPNGEPTTCSRCRDGGVDCVYSGPQKKRGPCPGTVRPATGSKSRRPSHRSSVASVGTTIMTPPSDEEWSTRSSYGFPPGLTPSYPSSRPPSQEYPKPVTPTSAPLTHRPSMPVLSWPGMQPAVEMDDTVLPPPRSDGPKVFRPDYSMTAGREESSRGFDDRKLPPLRIAIERSDSYYSS